MSEIRNALTRKLGPLPAWAWALIAGAAVFVYRSRGSAGTATTLDANTPGVTDNTAGLKDPLSLAPGESVYDPNTGQLIGTAPEQAPGGAPEPQSPITLEPGESLYDPNTGQLFGADATPAAAKKAAKTKRTPKAKPHHASKTKTARQPSHPKASHGKRHGVAKLVGKRIGKPKYKAAAKPKVKARSAVAHPKPVPRARAAAPRHAALRQRPAAPHITHPATQRSAPHPARPTPPPRHPAPAPRRRRGR